MTRIAGRLASTAAHRGWELARTPKLTSAEHAPPSARAITTEWLTDALCRDTPGARVSSFVTTAVTSQTTSRASLRLRYNDEGKAAALPDSVFVKLTASARQRLFLGLIRCIEGEPLFYRELRPLLDIECPRGYHGVVDPRSWRSAVVVEDIAATRGATFCHATTPIDRAAIESLLEVMAGYHGALWESNTVLRTPWLKRPIDHFHNTSAFLNMRKRVAVGVERTADRIPRRIRGSRDELWSAFLNSMMLCSSGPTTLLHGDPHVGNTYRTGAGRTALLDWQVCMQGSWAFDYAYAVSTALTVENRRQWERELLGFYLDALGRAGGQPPSFDDALRAYRQCLMYPFHT